MSGRGGESSVQREGSNSVGSLVVVGRGRGVGRGRASGAGGGGGRGVRSVETKGGIHGSPSVSEQPRASYSSVTATPPVIVLSGASTGGAREVERERELGDGLGRKGLSDWDRWEKKREKDERVREVRWREELERLKEEKDRFERERRAERERWEREREEWRKEIEEERRKGECVRNDLRKSVKEWGEKEPVRRRNAKEVLVLERVDDLLTRALRLGGEGEEWGGGEVRALVEEGGSW